MFTTFALGDIFSDCEILHYIPDRVRKEYEGVSLIPQSATGLEEDVLYLSPLGALPEEMIDDTNIHYACINDLTVEKAEAMCRNRENIFCLKTDLPFNEFASRIQTRFTKLLKWEKTLNDAVYSGCDYQYLVDLSEDILKNPIFVQGPDLYLLATSSKYPGSTKRQRDYQKSRYHTSEFIFRLKESGRLSYYKHHNDLIILTDHKIEPYDIVGSQKKRNGEPCIGFGVSCSVTPNTPYYLDLISTCRKYIFALEERNYQITGDNHRRGTDFIMNLISGTFTGETVIRDIATSLSLPFSGPFFLYKIVFPDNNNLPAYLQKELEETFRDDFIFPQDSSILILHTCGSLTDDPVKNACSMELEKLLASHVCKCCVSESFNDLTSLRDAFDQIVTTERFVSRMLEKKDEPFLQSLSLERFSERVLYSFREFEIRDIFYTYKAAKPAAVENNIFVRSLKKLIEYDKTHDRNLAEILYYYLSNDSNASRTAEQIHMSRNNVQYNIAKISGLTQLDLEDFRIRFGLLTAYNLLGVYFK